MTALPGVRYWTREEMHDFLVEHGLMISTGPEGKDEVALTRRGLELWAYLDAARILCGPGGALA